MVAAAAVAAAAVASAAVAAAAVAAAATPEAQFPHALRSRRRCRRRYRSLRVYRELYECTLVKRMLFLTGGNSYENR